MLCSTIISYSLVFFGIFSVTSLVFVGYVLFTFPQFFSKSIPIGSLSLIEITKQFIFFVFFNIHNSNNNRLHSRMHTFIMLEILKLFRIFNSNS